MSSPPTNGNARIQTIAALIGSGVVIFGAFYWVGTIASDVKSALDRIAGLQGEIAALSAKQAQMSTEIVALRSSSTEVETQFCDTGNVLNLMHANDMRIQAVLWQKAFTGTSLPTDNAFYPTLCHKGQ
jgi:hypothetical protein